MASNIRGITVEIGGDTTKLGSALSSVNSQSKALQTELKSVNRLLKLDPSNTELLSQKQNILKESISATKDKLNQLKSVQDQVKAQYESGEIDEGAYRAFQRELVATEQKLKELQNEAKSFGGVISQQVANAAKGLQDLGGKVEAVGKKFTAISATAGAILGGSIISASNFTDAMAKVNTIADTSEVSLDELKNQVLALSNQTGVSCNDIAEDVYNAISAGQSTGDAVNFVSNATNLARAGFAETGDALDILTTILNAYGLEAGKVTDVSDMLIQTQNKGKTTVAELSSSMGKIIPTANSMNVSLDQVCAGYAIMTSKGIATAESTTYMNSMLNELGKSSTKVGGILKDKTGKSFQELMADGNSLGDVLQILQDYSKESGIAFNELWGSAEAGKAGITLLSDGVESFNETAKGMIDSTGATSSAMEKLETPSLKAKKAVNEVKNAGVELGTVALSALAPVLDKIASLITRLTQWFSGLNDTTKTIIVTILGLVAGLAPALIIIGKVISAVGTIMTIVPKLVGIFNVLKGAIAGINAVMSANPIGAIIVAIVAVIAILVTLYNKCEWFRDGVNAILGAIVGFFKSAWENIKAVWDLVAPYFMAIWDAIKAVFSVVVEVLSGYFKLAWEYIKVVWDVVVQYFTMIWENIKAVFSFVADFFKNAFALAWLAVKTVWDVVTGYFSAIWETIKGIFSVVKDVLHGDFSGAWEAIKGIVSQWTGYFSGVWNSIKTLFSGVAGFFKNIFSSAWNMIKSVFSNVGSFFSGVIRTIKNAFTSLPSQMMSIGKNIIDGLINGIKSKVSGVVNAVKDIGSKITGKVKSILGIASPSRVMKAYGAYTSEGLAIGIKEKGKLASDAMENVVDDVIDKTDQSSLLKLGVNSSDTVVSNNDTAPKGDTVINFNGNYQFKDKDDIDYFMNEAGLRLAGVR